MHVRSLYSIIASPGRMRTRYRSNVCDPGDGRHNSARISGALRPRPWASCLQPKPRQQVIELAVRMAVDDPAEDVGQTVVDEAGQPVPARERIADCLGELPLPHGGEHPRRPTSRRDPALVLCINSVIVICRSPLWPDHQRSNLNRKVGSKHCLLRFTSDGIIPL